VRVMQEPIDGRAVANIIGINYRRRCTLELTATERFSCSIHLQEGKAASACVELQTGTATRQGAS
jgi:hypothetical protein